MKKMNCSLLLSLLLLSIIIMSGCSSTEQGKSPQRENFQDMSEEERQQMTKERQRDGFEGMPGTPGNMTDEERQQNMIDACKGKNEGDSCTTMSMMMGETEGTCEIMDNNLICTMGRPMGQPPEQR